MDKKSGIAALGSNASTLQRVLAALQARFTLAPNDLLRDAVYRRLWTSVLTSSFQTSAPGALTSEEPMCCLGSQTMK